MHLQTIESYIGTFFSKEWVQQNVLRLTDLEIEEMQKQINKEGEWMLMMVVLMFQKIQMVSQDTHQVDGAPISPDDVENIRGNAPPEDDKKINESKDFVDALARGSNLDAEDAFKSAIGTRFKTH